MIAFLRRLFRRCECGGRVVPHTVRCNGTAAFWERKCRRCGRVR